MRYKVYFFILFFSISAFLFSQNSALTFKENIFSVDDVFESAKYYEAQKDYTSAVKEWKRFLFLQNYYQLSDDDRTLVCLEKLSDYYLLINQNNWALSFINDALNYNSENSALINKLLKNKINILVKETAEKNALLRNNLELYALAFTDDVDIEIKKKAVTEILENDIKADSLNDFLYDLDFAFSVLTLDNSEHLYSKLLQSVRKLNKVHLKNPKLAAGLSVIPGFGQMYAQDLSDGLNSFLINGSLMALSAYSLLNLHFIEFSFLEFSPLYRFYRGNFYNAQKDSYEYNKKNTEKIQSEIIMLLKSL